MQLFDNLIKLTVSHLDDVSGGTLSERGDEHSIVRVKFFHRIKVSISHSNNYDRERVEGGLHDGIYRPLKITYGTIRNYQLDEVMQPRLVFGGYSEIRTPIPMLKLERREVTKVSYLVADLTVCSKLVGPAKDDWLMA